MEIIRAGKEHKVHVLRLLDDFRTECNKIINPEKRFVSTSAKDSGGPVFDKVLGSSGSAIFMVKEGNDYIGIATVHKIPQIKHGGYCAEIEDMYVAPEFQGSGAAKMLVDAVTDWAKENRIVCIRLESSKELKRAHSFYEKSGFEFYGRAYEKIIE